MSDHLLVTTTCDNRAVLEDMAADLVSKRLAACAQVGWPITSIYRWQGESKRDQEWVLTIKTSSILWSQLESAIRKSHPYDVPEIIAIDLAQISKPYQSWMDEQLDKPT